MGAGESQSGSAATGVRVWLLLEWRRPWGAKAPAASGLPRAVERRLAELAPKGAPVRVQLLRHPARTRGPLKLFLVATNEVWSLTVEPRALEARLQELSFELDHRALEAAGWRAEAQPIYLVCTHGKRDACCAKRGLPLFAALDGLLPGRVWQSTHLGGHRFAPTFTILPAGTSYGRVPTLAVPSLVAALEAGGVGEPSLVRGRCDLARDEQVAYGHLLSNLGEAATASPNALQLESRDGSVQRWRLGDRRFEVECAQAEALMVLSSCSDAGPKAVERWAVRRVAEL